MNILYLSLLYHPDEKAKISALSRDGMQNQIDNYQWAFINGLRENGQRVDVLNCLPVGAFPKAYRKVRLPDRCFGASFRQLGCINLPYIKQKQRARKAERAMEEWLAADPDNRTLLVYTLYLPYMQAVQAVKRRHPDVRAHVIVTDLPNEFGISSGRTGLLKRIEYGMGDRRVALCAAFDGFVLLTKYMTERLPIGDKPTIVIEGLVSPIALPAPTAPENAVLYAGTLNRELGVGVLLEAFEATPDVQLWLCGRGDMQAEVEAAAKRCANIRYFGFVPQERSLELQANAAALINPRTGEGLFTRYSFPSKTLEYMRSGKPVLCCALPGIPDAYRPYLRLLPTEDAQGIRQAVRELLRMPAEERERIGRQARDYVLREKSAAAQCARLVEFLRQSAR